MGLRLENVKAQCLQLLQIVCEPSCVLESLSGIAVKAQNMQINSSSFGIFAANISM